MPRASTDCVGTIASRDSGNCRRGPLRRSRRAPGMRRGWPVRRMSRHREAVRRSPRRGRCAGPAPGKAAVSAAARAVPALPPARGHACVTRRRAGIPYRLASPMRRRSGRPLPRLRHALGPARGRGPRDECAERFRSGPLFQRGMGRPSIAAVSLSPRPWSGRCRCRARRPARAPSAAPCSAPSLPRYRPSARRNWW